MMPMQLQICLPDGRVQQHRRRLTSSLQQQPWMQSRIRLFHNSSASSNNPSSSFSSSSESEDTVVETKGPVEIDADALLSVEKSIAAQQAMGLPPPYDLIKTRRIVETAMLAAVAGLSYTLATLFKLESYLSYILPLPVVLAAKRGGAVAALKSLFTAFLLLFILLGPFRALTYLLIYGLLSLSMGCSWALKLPWAVSVPLAAVARMAGFLSYFALSSWISNENLMSLMLTNIHNMLDQFSAIVGTAGAPSLTAVTVTLASLLLVNAAFYVFVMHVLYTLILRGMGYEVGPTPKFLQRFLGLDSDPLVAVQRPS